MSAIHETWPDVLIRKWEALADEIRAAEFPRLVVEEVTDDGETFVGLRCPRCGTLADYDNLAAVDQSVRWNYADTPDDDSFDHERLFFSQGDGEYSETLYYLHNDDHAVSLPEGWTEEWA